MLFIKKEKGVLTISHKPTFYLLINSLFLYLNIDFLLKVEIITNSAIVRTGIFLLATIYVIFYSSKLTFDNTSKISNSYTKIFSKKYSYFPFPYDQIKKVIFTRRIRWYLLNPFPAYRITFIDSNNYLHDLIEVDSKSNIEKIEFELKKEGFKVDSKPISYKKAKKKYKEFNFM